MGSLAFLQLSRIDVTSSGQAYLDHTIAELQDARLPPADILAGVQLKLAAMVDARAEQLRGTVLTPGSGQAMEYQEVQAQAQAALAAPANATPALYPMLAASIGIDVDPTGGQPATDVLGVARCAAARTTAWTVLGAAIRAARLKGKAAIAGAADIASACAAYDVIAWPVLPGPTST